MTPSNDNPISLFDTFVKPTWTEMYSPKSGKQIVEEVRACKTVEELEAWIERENYRRQIGETL